MLLCTTTTVFPLVNLENQFRPQLLISQFLSRQSRVVSVGLNIVQCTFPWIVYGGAVHKMSFSIRGRWMHRHPRVLYIAKGAQPTSVYLRWFYSKVIEICVGQSCICRLIAWQPYTLTVPYMSLANTHYDVPHFMKSIIHSSRICLVLLYVEISVLLWLSRHHFNLSIFSIS
jgi:hypothetical protein